MGLFKKKNEEVDPSKVVTFENRPFLLDLKPNEKYAFHSDYFQMDDKRYATIVALFHTYGSDTTFGPFWGIMKVPTGLPQDIVTVNFEQIERMGDGWIATHQTAAENVADMNVNSQDDGGTNTTKAKAAKSALDLQTIANELNAGASYLNVHDRMMVIAPTLEKLDDAMQLIERKFTDCFGVVWCAPYTGEQRQELANLFAKNERKRGKGFYYTSTEYAGSYNLVTHGLEDLTGEYVGTMTGDVNNSAVMFDIDRYAHHVVVASEQIDRNLGRAQVADMWGSKIAQSALIRGHRVVHFIFDNADLDRLGPRFDRITYRVDLNRGDVNMFEMFGEEKDELSIFPAHLEKLTLMAEQAYETTDSDRSVIRGSLQDVATKYYVEQGMWFENAKENRSRLRIVGIPHKDVPRLDMFVSYLDMEYKALANSAVRDDEKLHAMSILATTFRNLLSNNGDLFNTVTSDAIDGIVTGRRVVYDFSGLMRRGKGVAMAQLVNIIGYAVQTLEEGDVVLFHGAELIDPGVRDYVNQQLEFLYAIGGRAAYLYNDIERFMRDASFNRFDKADYTIIGNMSENQVTEYQKLLGLTIPPDLVNLLTARGEAVCYIRRDFDNVVFRQDLILNPMKTERKRRRRKASVAK